MNKALQGGTLYCQQFPAAAREGIPEPLLKAGLVIVVVVVVVADNSRTG